MLELTGATSANVAMPQTYKDAVALHKQGKIIEAKAAYEALIKQNGRNGDAWFGLGTVNAQLGASVEAIICFERAMGLMGSRPQIHHNMAAAKSALGRMAEAEVHYKEAIRLKPDYYEAYFNFANVRNFKNGAPVAASIEEHLATEGLGAVDLTFLHFAAGKIYDDMKAPDKAFPHYLKGNAAKGAQFDGEATRARFQTIADHFGPDVIQRFRGMGAQDSRVVLVVGMPRSGTTLVESVIASHAKARPAGELPGLNQTVGHIAQALGGGMSYPEYANHLTPELLQTFGQRFANFLAERVGDTQGKAAKIVDKTPLNFRHLGIAHLMLPNARIIHCRRHPLDTCLSCFFQNFRTGHEYSFDLESLGLYYGQYVRLMEHWRAAGVPFYDLNYAEFVQDIDTGARNLLEYVGLDWDPAVLEFHQNQRDVQTASRAQVRRPVYTSSVNRYRAYDAHLWPLKAALTWEGVELG